MKAQAIKAADALSAADVEVTDALGEHRETLAVRILSRIAKLGDQPELRLISGAVIVAGLALRRGRLFKAGVRMLLAHEVATSAKDVVKNRIDRTRPHSASDRRQARPTPGDRTAKKHSSFPSGHSAGAIAVAQAFARDYPEHRGLALAAAGIVAFGQIPKCAHYPSDVAAGALLGAASEAVVSAAWSAANRRFGETDRP